MGSNEKITLRQKKEFRCAEKLEVGGTYSMNRGRATVSAEAWA